MHTLAATLGCTVADIERGMSAREFLHWVHWMDAERVGPVHERVRHAELLAAIYNGASTRADGSRRPWSPADFLPADAEPAEDHAEELRRQLASMEGLFA
jgi:hypothetical protein